jgi:hypothetical protein
VFEAVPHALLSSAKLTGSPIGGIPHRAAQLCWTHAALCIARTQAEVPYEGLLGIVCDMCTHPQPLPSIALPRARVGSSQAACWLLFTPTAEALRGDLVSGTQE